MKAAPVDLTVYQNVSRQTSSKDMSIESWLTGQVNSTSTRSPGKNGPSTAEAIRLGSACLRPFIEPKIMKREIINEKPSALPLSRACGTLRLSHHPSSPAPSLIWSRQIAYATWPTEMARAASASKVAVRPEKRPLVRSVRPFRSCDSSILDNDSKGWLVCLRKRGESRDDRDLT